MGTFVDLRKGDALEIMRDIPDNSIDSIVTDSPYGLGKEPNPIELLTAWIDHGYLEIKGNGFMGKKWDSFVPQPILWKEAYRILKPGGYLLSFFGTRTYDWGTLAIRLAGFEIRDMITWHYGTGFPKSLNIGKALEKMDIDPAQYEDYGTALKPATEPICVARKPLDGTVAENILKYGTGGLNIGGCSIEFSSNEQDPRIGTDTKCSTAQENKFFGLKNETDRNMYSEGRFPSNLILDPYAAAIIDDQSGVTRSSGGVYSRNTENNILGKSNVSEFEGYGDSGGGSRFFYCAKASVKERHAGCEMLFSEKGGTTEGNDHPTVKPISVMRWLQRLVTPKGGTTLDMFAGSGTSGCSAEFEEINIILIEKQPEYWPIIEARVNYWKKFANRERYLQSLKDSQTTLF